jgi:hypothetical protein
VGRWFETSLRCHAVLTRLKETTLKKLLLALVLALAVPTPALAASLHLSPGVVTTGSTIHVEWRDVTTNDNNHRIGMYANSSASETSYIEERTLPLCTGGPDMVGGNFSIQDAHHKGMKRNGSCAFNSPSSTGTTFEFRLFQGGTRLATSSAFETISAGNQRQISDYFPNPVQAQSHILTSASDHANSAYSDVVVGGLSNAYGAHPFIVFGYTAKGGARAGDFFFWNNDGAFQMGGGELASPILTPRIIGNITSPPGSVTIKNHDRVTGNRDMDVTISWTPASSQNCASSDCLLTHHYFMTVPYNLGAIQSSEVFYMSDNVPICGTSTMRKGLRQFEHWDMYYYRSGPASDPASWVAHDATSCAAASGTWFSGVGCRTALTSDYCWLPRYR